MTTSTPPSTHKPEIRTSKSQRSTDQGLATKENEFPVLRKPISLMKPQPISLYSHWSGFWGPNLCPRPQGIELIYQMALWIKGTKDGRPQVPWESTIRSVIYRLTFAVMPGEKKPSGREWGSEKHQLSISYHWNLEIRISSPSPFSRG